MDPRKQRCPNRKCLDFGCVGGSNVAAFGVTRQGRRRFLCHTCGHTFCENAGSIFYRLKSQRERVLEALRWLAQGDHVTHVARRIYVKPQTLNDWLAKALSTPSEELGLTSQQMDNLRAQFAKLRRRRSTAGRGTDRRFIESTNP